MSNRVDPDETAHHEPSHLDLCCLQKPTLSPMAVKELSFHKSVKYLSDTVCIFYASPNLKRINPGLAEPGFTLLLQIV